MMPDLESVIDVNIIISHYWKERLETESLEKERLPGTKVRSPMAILELGGGFGRLAEALLNVIQQKTPFQVSTYWLVDAVPGSLLYCRKYLSAAFPKKRVGFYLDDGAEARAAADPLQAYDVYITSAWSYASMVRRGKLDQLFDITINIQSMQEMDAIHLHAHLDMLNRITKPTSGLHYNSNARSWQLIDSRWPWPKRWRPVFNESLPGRAWRRFFPTLVFAADDVCWRPMATSVGVLSPPLGNRSAGGDTITCVAPSLPPAALTVAIHFIVDEKLLAIMFPPTMKEPGFSQAATEICKRLEGFDSTAGNGVYGDSFAAGASDMCTGALLAMVDEARRHRDRQVAQQFGISPHSEPFTSAQRPAPRPIPIVAETGANAYCNEGEGKSYWEETQYGGREVECLIGWTFGSAIALEEGVVCLRYCDT